MALRRQSWIGLVLISFCLSCTKSEQEDVSASTYLPPLPSHFPAIEHPDDNAPSYARWRLGKALFFENALSKDSSLSCATCHLPEKAFANNEVNSPGAFGRAGTSNVPSLWNVAYQPHYLRSATVPTLEMQVLVPIQEENEFAHNIVTLAEELATNSTYARWSQEAYNRDLDPFVITRSIAQFERSLIAGFSTYDSFLNGDQNALSPSQQRGMALFNSDRLSCSSCHSGLMFTSYGLERNGTDTTTTAEGRYRFTLIPSDYGRFKVPSLRDVEKTAPYFHDGRYDDLEEVIEHYNRGGDPDAPSNEFIRPLNLSEAEKADLLAFLQSLTEPPSIQ